MLKKNIIANFLGTGYGMLLQFVMLPVTLHYLGPPAYGLIGIYATILAILSVLDLGLSPALGRELAKLSVLPDGHKKMYATVTTLEIICLIAAIGLALIIWLGAPLLAKYWFTKSNIPPETVKNCLQWMGLQAAFQFLTNYYSSGLVGMQRIVLNNGIAASTQSLRTLILIGLLVSSPKIETYFIYQATIGFFTLLITGVALYAIIPKVPNVSTSTFSPFQFIQNRFDYERFSASKRFAVGMAATTLSTLALTQLDKVILSKMLSLEEFGYYTVAASIANILAKPANLIFAAVLPRMTQLATSENSELLKATYLKASSVVSWIVLPTAGLLIVLNQQILTLYLHSSELATHIAPLFILLSIGTASNASMNIPYALTLAYGWTRFGVYITTMAAIIMVPMIFLFTNQYGALGAAGAWMALNISFFIAFMYPIHQKLFKGLLSKWYLNCLLPQVTFAALIAILTNTIYQYVY